jgi:hypothetical protein
MNAVGTTVNTSQTRKKNVFIVVIIIVVVVIIIMLSGLCPVTVLLHIFNDIPKNFFLHRFVIFCREFLVRVSNLSYKFSQIC